MAKKQKSLLFLLLKEKRCDIMKKVGCDNGDRCKKS